MPAEMDEETLKKAKEELNEDPAQRASQIETLRKWVKEQPHINSRTDDAFLLRFLRNAKFSQLRAQEKLENFWTVRSVEGKGCPDWFKGMDPMDPKLKEVLDLGTNIALPGRDDHNRKVVLVRTGHYDPKKIAFADVMKAGFLTTDILIQDDLTQVHGVVTLLDFSEFGMQHVYNWNRETISKASKCWQDVYPTRNKGVNFYNTPTAFNAIWEIFRFFMNEKTKQRIHFHKADLESLHKQVPKRILPKEYGGEAGPIDELAKNWKEEILRHRDELLSLNQYGVDESKRPAKPEQSTGLIGTFRRLAVD